MLVSAGEVFFPPTLVGMRAAGARGGWTLWPFEVRKCDGLGHYIRARVGRNPLGGGAVALKDMNDLMSTTSRASDDYITASSDKRSAPTYVVGSTQGPSKTDDTWLMRRAGVTPEGGSPIPPLHSGEEVTAAGLGTENVSDLGTDLTRVPSRGVIPPRYPGG